MEHIFDYTSPKGLNFNFIQPNDEQEINKIFKLQNDIYNNLENKKILCKSSYNEIVDAFLHKEIYCIYCNNELAGFFMVVKNRKAKRNYVSLIPNLTINYFDVVTFDIIIIAPKFRGHNLQQQALAFTTKLAKGFKQAKYICATVSPENYFSLNNFLNQNFKIYQRVCESYHNLDRYIVIKYL